MKSTTKFFGLIATLLALAAPSFAAQIGEDSLTIGKKGSSANKTIKMGAGRVVWNQSSSKLTFSNDSGGSFKNFGSGGGGGSGINLLQDSNFDFEGGTANWTASGGSFSAATAGSNLIFDVQSGVFNSSAASQTLSSTSVVIPQGFKNANGAAGCYFKTTASDYKLQVFDGANVLAEKLIPVISGAPQKISTSFIFPGSGNVRLRVISASDAADLAVDNCFLGENPSIQLAQAQHYGSMSITNCTGVAVWTSAGYSDNGSGGTACTYNATGNLSAPVGAYMGFRTAFPPGEYVIVLGHASSLTSAGVVFGTRISNGTVSSKSPSKQMVANGGTQLANSNDTYTLSIPTALSASDFRLQANMSNGNYSSDDTGANQMTFDVYKFPTQAQEAQTFATTAYLWQGSVSGTTALTSVTTADFPGTSTVTEISNTNAGTVVGSSVGHGIAFVPSGNGTYKVCATSSVYQSGTNASGSLTLTDGADGALAAQAQTTNGPAGGAKVVALCAHVPVASVAAYTVKLRGAVNSGTINATDTTWTVQKLTAQLPAPVLVGGIVTPLAGVVQTVYVAFAGASETSSCSTNPCVIYKQSGGVSSVTRGGTGAYFVNFAAGTFSAPPVCTGTAQDVAAQTFVTGAGIPHTTAIAYADSWNAAGVQTDEAVNMICMGPK